MFALPDVWPLPVHAWVPGAGDEEVGESAGIWAGLKIQRRCYELSANLSVLTHCNYPYLNGEGDKGKKEGGNGHLPKERPKKQDIFLVAVYVHRWLLCESVAK